MLCVLCVSNIKISVEYSNWRKRYSHKETETGLEARYIWLPLKAFCAALVAAVEAAFAAAVWTVLLDITPVANSCWAFSKLAPVVRYSPCTFLNMTSEMTADAVKSAAMIIIMIPTGMFLLRPVRDEIQPQFPQLWNPAAWSTCTANWQI